MHNYHSSNDVFPMGASLCYYNYGGGQPCTTWNNWSAHAMMLDYLEQAALYNAINFSLEAAGATTPAPRTPRPTTPRSPSSSARRTPTAAGSTTTAITGASAQRPTPAATSRRGMRARPARQLLSPTWGVFAFRLAYGLRDITDGSSNTIAFSEGQAGADAQTVTPGNMIMGAGLSGVPTS